jgi:hypothetical protein
LSFKPGVTPEKGESGMGSRHSNIPTGKAGDKGGIDMIRKLVPPKKSRKDQKTKVKADDDF